MRKFIIALLLSAALGFIFELPGLWWLMPVAGAVGGWIVQKGDEGFLAGGLGVTIAWGAYLLYFSLFSPIGRLMEIFSGILGLESSLAFVPVLLALIVAFLLGGLGGLCGAFINGVYRRQASFRRMNPEG